jgi:hypothetical protein
VGDTTPKPSNPNFLVYVEIIRRHEDQVQARVLTRYPVPYLETQKRRGGYAVEAEGGVTVVDVRAHAMEEAVFYSFQGNVPSAAGFTCTKGQ